MNSRSFFDPTVVDRSNFRRRNGETWLLIVLFVVAIMAVSGHFVGEKTDPTLNVNSTYTRR